MTAVDDLAAPERETVGCDEDCGAYVQPETLDEYKAALEHWMGHDYNGGCAHAC